MRRTKRHWLAATALVLSSLPANAQTPPAPAAVPLPQPTPAVNPNAAAATVNGQPILEAAVQRALDRIVPEKRREARPELLNFLIDNVLIEQYLLQVGIKVDPQEVAKRIDEMKVELEKQKKDFPKLLQDLKLTEAELREHVLADIRWDKYATSQATDAALRQLFDNNKEMFDGTTVRARHILLSPAPGDARAAEQAQTELLAFKQQIEAEVATGLSKLPTTTDALAKEKARTSLLDESFAKLAREKSACPSKAQGGDVNWFQRAGFMVEPFAKTAFALKTFQMSDIVKTQFGYHLILTTDRKAGKEVKFEDVKEDVKEVFTEKLRESLAGQLREKAKIAITPEKP